MAIACLKPDPSARRDQPAPTEPQVPPTYAKILKGEVIPNEGAGAGFEDDNGWPTLSGNITFDVDKDEAMAGRLVRPAQEAWLPGDPAHHRLRSSVPPHDNRRLFPALLQVRELRVPARPSGGLEAWETRCGENNVQIGWLIRSAATRSLPTYAEALRAAGVGRNQRHQGLASSGCPEDPPCMSRRLGS